MKKNNNCKAHDASEAMQHWQRAVPFGLCLLLVACASTTPAPRATPPVNAAAPAPAPAQTAAAAQVQLPPAPDAESLGINREGRVIDLSRVAETPPAFTPPANDSVELNYEQEDLRVVIEQLGGALGINMLIDPAINSRVSLRTAPGSPMRYADIWPLLRVLARNAGVSIEQRGPVYEFRLSPGALPSEIVRADALDEASSATVLQVTPLTYISREAAEAVLLPMLQPEGSVIRLGSANSLGIYGSPAQLARVNSLLSVIDDDPFANRGIRLYELANSRASDVATELSEVLRLIEGEQPAYQILGLDRINAVLVVAPAARGFDEVTRWIRLLDTASQEQVEQLFLYRVKNLKAVSLAATLTEVFGNNSSEERERRAAEREAAAAVPQPQAFQGGVLAALGSAFEAQDSAAQNVTSANLSVSIVADEETNSLLIRATPREYRQLLATLSSLDRLTPQVLIHAVIGQVTLTEGTRFGIDWTRISGNLASGPARLSSNLLPGNIFDQNGNPAAGSGLVLTRSFMDGAAVIDATLNAIAEDNDVTLLARPTILATNNREGSIHVGQSVPVNNGTTVVGNGVTTENIAYQDVGIDLTITPQINDDGFITLQIEQVLSSVEEGVTGVADNPTFTDQRINTTVVVADQSTITLGGLIQEEESDQQRGVPGLMGVPGLGRLFAYTDQRRVRRELFVILRPQILNGGERDSETLRAFRDSFSHVVDLLQDAGL